MTSSTNPTRGRGLALIVASGFAVVLAVTIWSVLTPNDRPVLRDESGAQSRLAIAAAEQRHDLRAAETAESMAGVEQVLREAAARALQEPREGADSTEWSTLPRKSKNIDLARIFVETPDAVSLRLLARHAMLNPMDLKVDAQSLNELQAVIDYYEQRLKPLVDEWRSTAQLEMMEQIDRGELQPAVVRYRSEEEVDRFMASKPIPADQRAQVRRMFLQQPLIEESYISHGGKIYELARFGSLPVSDTRFEGMKYFSLEFLGAVTTWFEKRGLCSAATANSLLDSASKLTARDLRQTRGPVGTNR